jgi:hypothetical protein
MPSAVQAFCVQSISAPHSPQGSDRISTFSMATCYATDAPYGGDVCQRGHSAVSPPPPPISSAYFSMFEVALPLLH